MRWQELVAGQAWAHASVLERVAAEARALDVAIQSLVGEEEGANLAGGPCGQQSVALDACLDVLCGVGQTGMRFAGTCTLVYMPITVKVGWEHLCSARVPILCMCAAQTSHFCPPLTVRGFRWQCGSRLACQHSTGGIS